MITNNLQTHQTCLENLPDTSRVWLFHSTRIFNKQESEQLVAGLQKFVAEWTSHSRSLKADATLLYNRFIVLAVDEAKADASGCSIDNSIRFPKNIEQHFDTQLFDRFWLAYRDHTGEVISASKDTLSTRLASGDISLNTTVFNTLINNLGDLRREFELPLGGSWYKRLL